MIGRLVAKLPSPTERVNVRGIRVRDPVDIIWCPSKDPFPKADNRRVLKEYSQAMQDLLADGYEPGLRPSGHDISDRFQKDLGGHSSELALHSKHGIRLPVLTGVSEVRDQTTFGTIPSSPPEVLH